VAKKKKENTTVHDIAKHLNISASTVSRALNDHPKISQATKNKVKEVALLLGYVQNVSTALRQELIGKTAGIIVPDLTQLKYTLMVESCRTALEAEGYQVIVCCTSDSTLKEKKVLKLLENLEVDGVIASLSVEKKNLEYFQTFAEKKPLILFDRISFDIPCNKVIIDHFQAGFRAVQHLLNIGCKKIAHIGGNINCPLTKQIAAGYKSAARNNGAVAGPKFELFSDILYEDVIKIVNMIFSGKEKPDALLIDDILSAQKLVSVLITRRVEIPDDVAIVAIGDERDYSYYSPSITTIQLPYQKMGAKAAELLLKKLNENDKSINTETVVVPFNLNIRNSTLRK
jgi:LacI family transcriptional regulator